MPMNPKLSTTSIQNESMQAVKNIVKFRLLSGFRKNQICENRFELYFSIISVSVIIFFVYYYYYYFFIYLVAYLFSYHEKAINALYELA